MGGSYTILEQTEDFEEFFENTLREAFLKAAETSNHWIIIKEK
jgi:hypothetical protein